MNEPGSSHTPPGSPRQLTLGVGRDARMRFSNFVPGPNDVVLDTVENAVRDPLAAICYIWGPAASGRTHLLQASCAQCAVRGGAAAYVPLADPSVRPAMLEGLESARVVCVDDVQVAAGDAAWEEALFHLYNRIERRQGSGEACSLLVAGSAPPLQLPFDLDDLRSRLAAGITCQLRPLEDEDLIEVLKRGAHERGFELSGEVASYLLRRERREMAHLMSVLDTLDRGSLEAKRRLTVAFVRELLGIRR